MVEDESLMDFRYLERIDELKNEIKKFYKEYGPLEQYLSNFLFFYQNRVEKKRKKREKEIMNKRSIREEKEIEIRKLFKKNHIKTDENILREVREHNLRWEKEKEIRDEEDKREKSIQKKENEMIEKIRQEIKEQKVRLKEQRRQQEEFEREYIRRQREQMREEEEEGNIITPNLNSIKLSQDLPSDKKSCIICLIDMKINDKIIILPCTHSFHEKCIIEWLKKKSTCPLCKEKVNK